MDDNGIDLFDADSPVRLTLATLASRCPGLVSASARPPTGRGGVACGATGGVGLSAQPAGAGAGGQRLIGPALEPVGRRIPGRPCDLPAEYAEIMLSAEILDELNWRGLIAQSTDLDALAAELAPGR